MTRFLATPNLLLNRYSHYLSTLNLHFPHRPSPAERSGAKRAPAISMHDGTPESPSRPFGLSLSALMISPLRCKMLATVLRASRALFWRTRGSPAITGRRIEVLAGGLPPRNGGLFMATRPDLRPLLAARLVPWTTRLRFALHGSVVSDGDRYVGVPRSRFGSVEDRIDGERSELDTQKGVVSVKLCKSLPGMKDGFIVHSDRGAHYCAHDYRRLLKAQGLIPSRAKKGDCYDSAAMEIWNRRLKVEAIHGARFSTR